MNVDFIIRSLAESVQLLSGCALVGVAVGLAVYGGDIAGWAIGAVLRRVI